jgi:hypothetical protein
MFFTCFSLPVTESFGGVNPSDAALACGLAAITPDTVTQQVAEESQGENNHA